MHTIKIKLDAFSNISKSLTRLIEVFTVCGYEIFLVGGCVRDALLNRIPKDIDLCTNATPDEMKKIAHKFKEFHLIETGLKHGTATFLFHSTGETYEVTTYRVDGDYSDGRHPDAVTFTPSLEEDLKRRDLTINSFAYNPLSEELNMLDKSFIDDINYGIIRTVGNPNERFTEDALRMLRAIRFSAQLGFIIDEKTFAAIREESHRMSKISKERIRDELTKILLSDHPETIEMLMYTKLEEHTLPLRRLFECKQHNRYHYTDVLHHTLDVVRSVPKDFELRWAALLHDFGKPDVESTEPSGINHYYEHESKSFDYAVKYTTELKFDNESIKNISTIIKEHNRPLSCKMPAFKRLVNDVGIELFPKYLELRKADAMSHVLHGEIPDVIQNLSSAKERYLEIINNKPAMSLKDLTINGNDLKAAGLVGKDIGIALNKCLDFVICNPDENNKETLMRVALGSKNYEKEKN